MDPTSPCSSLDAPAHSRRLALPHSHSHFNSRFPGVLLPWDCRPPETRQGSPGSTRDFSGCSWVRIPCSFRKDLRERREPRTAAEPTQTLHPSPAHLAALTPPAPGGGQRGRTEPHWAPEPNQPPSRSRGNPRRTRSRVGQNRAPGVEPGDPPGPGLAVGGAGRARTRRSPGGWADPPRAFQHPRPGQRRPVLPRDPRPAKAPAAPRAPRTRDPGLTLHGGSGRRVSCPRLPRARHHLTPAASPVQLSERLLRARLPPPSPSALPPLPHSPAANPSQDPPGNK